MKYDCGTFSVSFAFTVKLTVMDYFSGLLQKERTLSTVFAIALIQCRRSSSIRMVWSRRLLTEFVIDD